MPTLLDHRGEAVDLSALEEEHVTASVGGVRTPIRDSVANTLSPKSLGTLFANADEGDVESYLTLAEEIEEREFHYRSVLNTRKLSVAGAPATVEAGEDSEDAQEKADAVRRDILDHPAFRDLLFDLVDGLGKGYAIIETIWDTEGSAWKPQVWKWRDPRFFVWDPQTLQHLRLITESNQVNGEPLPPFKFLSHAPKLKSGMPVRGGLARPGAVGYMLKSFTVRDWMVFMETFGQPIRVGKYGDGATKKEIDKLKKAVTNIGVNSAGVIHESMDIQLEQAGNLGGAQALFKEAAQWWDQQVSKLVLGQTMTSEDGSSRAQAEVHQDTQLTLTRADCWQVSATINRDLVRPYIDLNFGQQDVYPRINVKPHEPEDQEKKARTVSVLVKAGLRVPAKWAYDEFGIPQPEGDDEEVLSASPPPAQPQEPPEPPPAQNASQLARRVDQLERALNQQQDNRDTIDEIAEEHLAEWERLTKPNVGRVLDIAKTAQSADELRQMLDAEADEIGIDEITRDMATATFKARGLGDASDDPNA